IGAGSASRTRHHGLRCLATYDSAAPAARARSRNSVTWARSPAGSAARSAGRARTRFSAALPARVAPARNNPPARGPPGGRDRAEQQGADEAAIVDIEPLGGGDQHSGVTGGRVQGGGEEEMGVQAGQATGGHAQPGGGGTEPVLPGRRHLMVPHVRRVAQEQGGPGGGR